MKEKKSVAQRKIIIFVYETIGVRVRRTIKAMTGFGEALRHEREARGMAIAEICAATKVSERHVVALEAGEFKRLPGGVFRKGIVRGYLRALGLDEPVWMERFVVSCGEMGLGEAGDSDWVEFAENVRRGRGMERSGLGWKWFGVVMLMVGLWVVGWLAWTFVRHHRMAVREVASVSRVDQGKGSSGV